MKRYITAREMPFIPVGTNEKLIDGTAVMFPTTSTELDSRWFHEKEIKQMLKEGWIKEVSSPSRTTPTPVTRDEVLNEVKEIESKALIANCCSKASEDIKKIVEVINFNAKKTIEIIDAINQLRTREEEKR